MPGAVGPGQVKAQPATDSECRALSGAFFGAFLDAQGEAASAVESADAARQGQVGPEMLAAILAEGAEQVVVHSIVGAGTARVQLLMLETIGHAQAPVLARAVAGAEQYMLTTAFGLRGGRL